LNRFQAASPNDQRVEIPTGLVLIPALFERWLTWLKTTRKPKAKLRKPART
jgi:hypothetical protein